MGVQTGGGLPSLRTDLLLCHPSCKPRANLPAANLLDARLPGAIQTICWAARTSFNTCKPPLKSPHGKNTSQSEQQINRPIVLPTQIMKLPTAGKRHGVHGYFMAPHHPLYQGHLLPEILFSKIDVNPTEQNCYTLD